MKENLRQIGIFILHVVLTALASAGIALLQSYIKIHGFEAGPSMTPENNAVIGTTVGALVKMNKLI